MFIIHTRSADPFSRAIKILLGEKRANFHAIEEHIFDSSNQLLALDKMGRTPILIDNMWENGTIIKEPFAAIEYIEDIIPTPAFLPSDPKQRAEVRSMCFAVIREFAPLFDMVFDEKIQKVIKRLGPPDTNNLRKIRDNTQIFLNFLSQNLGTNEWLVNNKMSLADIIVAAQISLLDYLDLISWQNIDFRIVLFYAKFKHSPSFTAILNESIEGILPPKHYRLTEII